MHELCLSCLLFIVALAGGFVGVVLANSLAMLVWVCTRMKQEARQRKENWP